MYYVVGGLAVLFPFKHEIWFITFV